MMFRLTEKEVDDQISQHYNFSYSEICIIGETKDVHLFKRSSYEVLLFIFLMANKMHFVNSVFDIGAGPDLIRKDFLNADCLKSIQPNNCLS